MQQSIRDEAKAEGLAEGEAKGKAEGLAKGKAELLKRLLTRRFGQLPDWAIIQIETAEIAQLELWAEAIFEAQNIEVLLQKNGTKILKSYI